MIYNVQVAERQSDHWELAGRFGTLATVLQHIRMMGSGREYRITIGRLLPADYKREAE